MMRWLALHAGLVVLGMGGTGSFADGPATARGVVFHDLNRNGTHDRGEPGIPGVRVSNGREIVTSGDVGQYELPVDNDTIVFLIKPRNLSTWVDELQIPRFYYIHKPEGSPKQKYAGVAPTGQLPNSLDLPLYEAKEPDRFRVIVFGDTQPRDIREVEYIAHDVLEDVIGTQAEFGITLGDLCFDDLDVLPPLNQAVARIGVPWRHVIGNHDMNYDSPDDGHSNETYQRIYGPPYYSFDYGPVHFIMLDDIVWHGKTEDKRGYYEAGLGPDQLEFVKNDLALVPKDQLVVLSMHIPIDEIKERKELFALLAQHPHTLSFSAHTHIQQHMFLGAEQDWPGAQPHHHINFATVCGSWWTGNPDEYGIPHTMMRCGAPNGWSVATFDGTRYSVEFHPARRRSDQQMHIYAPESVPQAEVGNTEILVNVFAGSERSQVQMRVGEGEWTSLQKVEREDPYFAALKQLEKSDDPPHGRKLPDLVKSPHMWSGRLPAGLAPGTHVVEVSTGDMFGHMYLGRRLIRVE